jgi:hypothetical protein
LPLGCFLLAVYDRDPAAQEAILLRVIGPTALPTDSDVVASMVDYYKEDLPTGTTETRLDSYTRYEFQFSGIDCRILGTFYRNGGGGTLFGADVDNFFSANNYSVYKPSGKLLEFIVNFREGTGVPGGQGDVRFGRVRYSSAMRHPLTPEVPVYVSAFDFVGKRTALFGMTRTGKSNTVKKLIQATVDISERAHAAGDDPLLPVGQIIFDVNGEYANENQQDEGTAIFKEYGDVIRYSILEKPGFRIMKVNFYDDLETGFEMLKTIALRDETADYAKSFMAADLTKPDDEKEYSAMTRWRRKVAAYQCCLVAAGFPYGKRKIAFPGCKELDALSKVVPDNGVDPDSAVQWFSRVWEEYGRCDYLCDYPKDHGHEWADEDLKALMIFLTRKTKPGGYIKLRDAIPYHTDTLGAPYDREIVGALRRGQVVIVDLSQGDPIVQNTFSERLCRAVFKDAMKRFIDNEAANVIQLYFVEAHNLFPRRTEQDLSNVYNRLAKEGAKLRLGLVYATQEVTSISSNILKNTQNWFVSHLNNTDELKEISRYYDFEDFTDSLRTASDRGFIRMKTYSNAFVVPVQIDRFLVKEADK